MVTTVERPWFGRAQPPASHVSATRVSATRARIGLTPEVGGRSSRTNHALTCVVTTSIPGHPTRKETSMASRRGKAAAIPCARSLEVDLARRQRRRLRRARRIEKPFDRLAERLLSEKKGWAYARSRLRVAIDHMSGHPPRPTGKKIYGFGPCFSHCVLDGPPRPAAEARMTA